MKNTRALAILLAALSLTQAAAAAGPSGCRLPPAHAEIRLACTTGCSARFQDRIGRAAAARGYRVRFLALKDAASGQALPPEAYDALLVPGGKDIDVELYAAAIPEPERERARAEYARLGKRSPDSHARDLFEHAFFERYFSDERFRGIPALGICYGMQMLAVSNGLPLVIDLPADLGIPARYNLFDTAHASPGTEIAAILGTSFQGYEQHHQAVDLRGFERLRPAGVSVTATSNGDRIPEAMEYSARPALGVQFHPEFSSLEVSDRIFGWLLDRACERANQL